MLSAAKIEAFCGRLRSTSSSGRSDAGKNWRGISGSSRTEPTNRPSVTAIVSQRARKATARKSRYQRTTRGGSGGGPGSGALRMARLSKGAKITATSHETSRATVTTANRVKQYSPAELCAKPIGTKPAMVTSVPASIENA